MSDQPWMDCAWSHIGVHETPGEKATDEIVGFFARAGHPEVKSDETAWCAAFAGACLADAGLPNTGSLMARSYLKYGTELEAPKVGAIAVFKRGSDPTSGHVAFVTGWGDGVIRVLGGNQRDSVCEEAFKTDALVGLRWPPVVAAPSDKPLSQSVTVAVGVSTGIMGTLLNYFETAVQIGMQTASAFSELAPLQSMLGNVAGNVKALSWAMIGGALSLVLTRKAKEKVQ